MTRFEMEYTKSDMESFFKETAKKKMMKNLIMIYSAIIIVVFLILFIAAFLTDGFFSLKKTFPFLILGVLVLFSGWAIFRTLKTASDKMYENFAAGYDGSTIVTCFEEDKFYVGSVTAGNNEENTILYSELAKAVESDNYFYIFVNAKEAQIIRK